MSLIEQAMTSCVFVEKRSVSDGEGGFIPVWEPGAEFKAAITVDESIGTKIAQKESVLNVYSVATKKSVSLEFHDVFRRISDGQTFRVTSDGKDKKTPNTASIDVRVVSAERWEIPV